jgi:DNA-binding transcriptional LysR family regulator
MATIDTGHLRHFVAVAETGSFHKAAQICHLTQPAITKSIQRMESWLGYALFDRGAHLELTAFGKLLLEQARKALLQFDDLQHEAELLRNLAIGELTIGAGPLMAESIVGPAAGRLLTQHPNLRVTIHVDNFNQFPERLRRREMDLFIADITLIEGDQDFEIIEVPPQEGVWFCRPGHPLAGQRSVSLEEFFRYPIVLPMLTPWAREWLVKNHPSGDRERAEQFRPALVCSHFSTLKAAVRNSDCLSGAIAAAMVDEFAEGRFVPVDLKAPKLYSKPGIVSLKGRSFSPTALALMAEVKEQFSGLSRPAETAHHASPITASVPEPTPVLRERFAATGQAPRRKAGAAR